jgi:hypothetical protein
MQGAFHTESPTGDSPGNGIGPPGYGTRSAVRRAPGGAGRRPPRKIPRQPGESFRWTPSAASCIMGVEGLEPAGDQVTAHLTRRAACIAVSLALAFTVIVPLHAHTCGWLAPSAGAAALEPVSHETGSTAGHHGECLACTLHRRLQARATVAPVGALGTIAVTSPPPTSRPHRPRSGVRRLTPPRGPPLLA